MRRVASGVLGVLAIVGLVVGSVGVWAHATIFDQDEVVVAANRTFADVEVRAGLADFITAEVLSLVDVDPLVESVVPDRLAPLGPMITRGLKAKLNSQVESLLATDRAERLMDQAVRQAHSRAMRVLAGQDLVAGVSARDSQVSLNLLPLITRAAVEVQSLGVLERLNVPEFDREGDPQAQVAEFSRFLGRRLPSDFGQLVVYRGSLIDSAQTTISLAQRIVIAARRGTALAVALTLVAGVGSVLLARSKRRAMLYLSLTAGVVLVILRSAIPIVIDQVSDLVTNPAATKAVVTALQSLTESLTEMLGVMILVAALIAVVSLLLSVLSGSGRRVQSG